MSNEQKPSEGQKKGKAQKPAPPSRKVPYMYISKPKTDASGEPQKAIEHRTLGPEFEAHIAMIEAQMREDRRELDK